MTRSPPPMDLFTDVFRWHDRYLPPLVQPDGLLLLSETELLSVGSPGVLAVERVLREGVSLASHCRTEGPPALLAEMLHALEALVRQGLVRPVRGDGAARYVVPDFSSPGARVRLNEQADVVVLSKAVDEEAALRWWHEVASGGALTIVFCDDYLDPRLGQIDAKQWADKRPWLLVKPSGEQAMVGPLFAPHEATACWHCLAHRLLRNQPARAWWQARHGGEAIGVPVRADRELIEARLKDLLALARGTVAQRSQQLWTLDPLQPHTVVARPQCPHCGDAGLMARLQREPVTLAPCLASARPDGGWRTMPASATVARLASHVDPLCGVIARVVPLGDEVEDALTVYRSEIFRTPAAHGTSPANALAQVCLGKGMSTEQSRASAMCEAIERYAAFHQGDEAFVIAAASALDARCIPAHELARFSERQREEGKRPPHAVALQAASANDTAWWAPAWSLTSNERCYLPLSFCYANAPAQSQRHAVWTSNGCAAGNTREEAILQGFLELVERDAAAIWWYGRIQRPAIDLGILSAESLARVARGLGPSWHYWMLDITHDFGIPVVAAIGRHRTTGDWAIGFGCSPNPVLACERALTEMSQLIAAEKKFVVPHSDDANGAPRFLMPGDATPMRPAACAAEADIAQEIARCVGIASALGMETVVLDHTRPDIPLCTVKVVVPGLCHIWPELGNPRLYRVPVAMGWRSAPLQESDLNPQALYV
ncbi:TOMM precursor leader peptide-binding protein [Variovorax sp. IB41]|uniref:TOMM precursor leader peptide-binding protein n=1 Tax=Variovorax sp. IB41 TaxID=2779370 RepID=UPI0018E8DBC6|nr:TOMM precursor leader peptide-binding protein [Variovorax sp. IB41]MBJ2154405.1 TOMM precursor leader peptide-binding protein [Variovorax sp. IB41]